MAVWRLAGLSAWLRGRPSWVRGWLAGHREREDEPVFQNRLRQSAALLMLFRVLGTSAAVLALLSEGRRVVAHPWLLASAVGCYLTYCLYIGARLVSIPLFRNRVRRVNVFNHDTALLAATWFLVADALVAVTLNLMVAVSLAGGMVYEEYTDVFLVAAIGVTTLATGRRGPARGMAYIVLFAAVELAKAPVSRLPLSEIDWGIVATRQLWAIAGIAVGVGMRHMFADFSRIAERLSLANAILRADRLALDRYVKALLQARDLLEHSETPPRTRLAAAREVIAEAGSEVELARVQGSEISVRHVMDAVKVEMSWTAPQLLLEIVFAGGSVNAECKSPEHLRALLKDLACGAQAAGAGMCTIRWRAEGQRPSYAVVTALDTREDAKSSPHHRPPSADAFEAAGGQCRLAPGRRPRWSLRVPLRWTTDGGPGDDRSTSTNEATSTLSGRVVAQPERHGIEGAVT